MDFDAFQKFFKRNKASFICFLLRTRVPISSGIQSEEDYV